MGGNIKPQGSFQWDRARMSRSSGRARRSPFLTEFSILHRFSIRRVPVMKRVWLHVDDRFFCSRSKSSTPRTCENYQRWYALNTTNICLTRQNWELRSATNSLHRPIADVSISTMNPLEAVDSAKPKKRLAVIKPHATDDIFAHQLPELDSIEG